MANTIKLKSQEIIQLPVAVVVSDEYDRLQLQALVNSQLRMLKALQADVVALHERVTILEP